MHAPASGKQNFFHLERELEMRSIVQPLLAHNRHGRSDALIGWNNRPAVTADAALFLEFRAHQFFQVRTLIHQFSGTNQEFTAPKLWNSAINLRLRNGKRGSDAETAGAARRAGQ